MYPCGVLHRVYSDQIRPDDLITKRRRQTVMPKAEKERPCLEQGQTLVVYSLGAREKGSNYREPVPWPNPHLAQYLPLPL